MREELKIISGAQIAVLVVPLVIVLLLISYRFGAYDSKQFYINYGAAQHWQGKIECGHVGKEVFCAKAGVRDD